MERTNFSNNALIIHTVKVSCSAVKTDPLSLIPYTLTFSRGQQYHFADLLKIWKKCFVFSPGVNNLVHKTRDSFPEAAGVGKITLHYIHHGNNRVRVGTYTRAKYICKVQICTCGL